MQVTEKKKTIADLLIAIALTLIGCFLGKFVCERAGFTWFCFNVHAIGTLLIGELIWWRAGKSVFKE